MSAHESNSHPAHAVHETAPMHDPVDQWHDHARDPRPQHAHGEVQNSGLVMGVGLALTMVIVVSVVIVYGFYTHFNARRMDIRERTNPSYAGSPPLLTREEKGKALLLLQQGGTTQMPTEKEGVTKTVTVSKIEDAMSAVAQEYAGRKAAQSH